jgi:hypothetical protein
VPWPSESEQAVAVSALASIEQQTSEAVKTYRLQQILVQKLAAAAIGQLYLTDSGLPLVSAPS